MRKGSKGFTLLLVFLLAFGTLLAGCGQDNANPPAGNTTDQGNQQQNTGQQSTGNQGQSSQPVDGGDLVVGAFGNPTNFIPFFADDTASSDISDVLFNALTRTNEKLEPEPDLAESWTASEDGLTWTFKLKQGVKWHDGQEFTADDVVFTYFTVAKSPDLVSSYKSEFENVESVKALDKYTVEIKLKQVDADFLQRVAGFYVLPKHILEKVPVKDLNKHEFGTKKPVGTGPFKFVEWVEGQYVKVERFEDYFEGKPHLKSITWRFVPDQNALLAQLQAGEINAMQSLPASDYDTWKKMADEGKIQVVSGLGLAYTYIGWNLENPLFKDKKVRQALTHALDRKAFVDAILNGQGEVAHVPESPLSWAYSDNVPKFEYDVEKAKQLLAEAGWKDTNGDGILDKDGKKFSFEIMTNQGNKAREMVAQIVQQQLKEVGIEVKPRMMEWSAFLNDYVDKKRFEAVILGWSLSTYPDQYDIWHSSNIPDPKTGKLGFNFVSYNNPELDKKLEENRRILDKEKRKQLLAEIYGTIAEDQPYTFLYYPKNNHALPPKMKGFTFHPKNFFYKTHEWYLEQ